ncbi:MAG: hypothetical protein HY547_02430 [Elusimicrobia bacterium]|nr:hypothetical protein [Elusimicrobiota bacterium]
MRKIIFCASILIIIGSISYAGFHFGLGKAAAKKSVELIEKAVEKDSSSSAGGAGGSLPEPGGLSFSQVGITSFTVAWAGAGHPLGTVYTVQIATSAGWTTALSTTATTATFTGLLVDINHDARARLQRNFDFRLDDLDLHDDSLSAMRFRAELLHLSARAQRATVDRAAGQRGSTWTYFPNSARL